MNYFHIGPTNQPLGGIQIPCPTSDVTSSTAHDAIPCAISLMKYSQDLSSNFFDVVTTTIFKQYSVIFGGFNPHRKELILSALKMRLDTYKDVLVKL